MGTFWPGTNPPAWIERRSAGVLKGKLAFVDPTFETDLSVGVMDITFPQFEGETNIDPEVFMTQGRKGRLILTAPLLPQDDDMSLGTPGSINSIDEQYWHIYDTILPGRIKDEFRLYIKALSEVRYITCILENINVRLVSKTLEGTITARFIVGENPMS